VPYLADLWTESRARRLVEPFCGGLAVALSLRPRRALLNDKNIHAVHVYSWLKRGLKVNESLEFANRETLYYEHRQRFNQLISQGEATSAEAAALFYYLNRTCYYGLCRFNSSGLFNVPFGRYMRIKLCARFQP
jgi:DNA adenine methylase